MGKFKGLTASPTLAVDNMRKILAKSNEAKEPTNTSSAGSPPPSNLMVDSMRKVLAESGQKSGS
ncbi:MAG: hypothetical protein KJ947_11570 [Alphaproteobacteria bacterium]|nr:hypothetical protein [Alphaproteobacteria bacterium]MBU1550195.1 hypothetical protein [Alphaproteobacteria bacterium]MBU2337884.1 hypothetical protein [Alphaproteobacteria bacterium]MBU2387864.1 hypothetical protein [Alphaproteobacteria bacterium]